MTDSTLHWSSGTRIKVSMIMSVQRHVKDGWIIVEDLLWEGRNTWSNSILRYIRKLVGYLCLKFSGVLRILSSPIWSKWSNIISKEYHFLQSMKSDFFHTQNSHENSPTYFQKTSPVTRGSFPRLNFWSIRNFQTPKKSWLVLWPQRVCPQCQVSAAPGLKANYHRRARTAAVPWGL